MKNQKKIAVVLSYINIVSNMLINIFLTPFLLRGLGQAEYGVYKVIASFIGQLSIISFGMATLVMRNIVYYNTRNEKEEKENFLFMSALISVFLAVITIIVGMIMYLNIENIFSESFTPDEMFTAKKLTVLFVLNVSVTIFGDGFTGIVNGHEKFAVLNTVRVMRTISRSLIVIMLLNWGFKSQAIITVDLIMSVLFVLFNIIYSRCYLKEKTKFHYWDFDMLKTVFMFSGAFFLQAIVNQVNNNMDNFILGVMTDTKTVAVYSIALTIYVMYTTLSTTLSSVFTPSAVKLIAKNASRDELTKFVVKPGRYQFIVAGAILGGFFLCGKEFLNVWLGSGYESVYYISLILMVPMTLPLVENTTNSILDALLKRMSRSIILIITAIINVILSIIFIKAFGYIGAAFGTATSVIIGQNIVTNWYLYKYIKLDVLGIIKGIFNRLLICFFVCIIVLLPMTFIETHTFTGLAIKLLTFIGLYTFIMYKFGMVKSEKEMFKGIINKFIKKGC